VAADDLTRSPASGRRDAICSAALDVLVDEGYSRMTMDAVAARARASKATIYRHWAGKQELILEALRQRGPLPFEVPDTGSLRSDVLATLRLISAGMLDADAALVCGVVGALRSEPEIADAVRREVIDGKRAISHTLVARAVARGEVAPDVDPEVFHEVAPALMFFRLHVLAEPADEEFLVHITDEVLLPLMSRRREPRLDETTPPMRDEMKESP
jgi:AcrR family transcriptional regulator